MGLQLFVYRAASYNATNHKDSDISLFVTLCHYFVAKTIANS